MVNNAALLAGRQQLTRKPVVGDPSSQLVSPGAVPLSANQPPRRHRKHHTGDGPNPKDGQGPVQIASIGGGFLTTDFDNLQPIHLYPQSSLGAASVTNLTSDRHRQKTPDGIQRLMQTPYSEWEPHLQESVLQLVTNNNETSRGSVPSSRRTSAANVRRKSHATTISRPESPLLFQSDDEDDAFGYGDEFDEDYMSAAEEGIDAQGSNIEGEEDQPNGVGGFKVEFYGQDRDAVGFVNDSGLVRREQLKPKSAEQRTEWLEARFEALQENQCKDILLAMIHAIEPRKNRLYPYQKKGQPACQRPPWWPIELEYGKGPHHMQCPARRSLLVHLTLLPLNDQKAYSALEAKRVKNPAKRNDSYTWWIDMLRDSVSKVRLIDKCAEDKLMQNSSPDGRNNGKKRKQRQHAEDKIIAKKHTLEDIFGTAQDILDAACFGDCDPNSFITTNDIPAILRKDKDSHPEHPSKSRKRSHTKPENVSAATSFKEQPEAQAAPKPARRTKLRSISTKKKRTIEEPGTEPDTDLDQSQPAQSTLSKPRTKGQTSKAETEPLTSSTQPVETIPKDVSAEAILQTEPEAHQVLHANDELTSTNEAFITRDESYVTGYPQPVMLSAMPWPGDHSLPVNMPDYTHQMSLPTDGISPEQTQHLYDASTTEQAWPLFPNMALYSAGDEYSYGAPTTAQSSFTDIPSNSFSTTSYHYPEYRGGHF